MTTADVKLGFDWGKGPSGKQESNHFVYVADEPVRLEATVSYVDANGEPTHESVPGGFALLSGTAKDLITADPLKNAPRQSPFTRTYHSTVGRTKEGAIYVSSHPGGQTALQERKLFHTLGVAEADMVMRLEMLGDKGFIFTCTEPCRVEAMIAPTGNLVALAYQGTSPIEGQAPILTYDSASYVPPKFPWRIRPEPVTQPS